MNNKKKNELAKIALTAFLLSAAAPAVGNAFDTEAKGTLLAGGGCRAGGCGAATKQYPNSSRTDSPKNQDWGSTGTNPKSSGCGASSSPKLSGHSCGASTPKYSGCGASTPKYSGCGASTPSTDTTGRMNQQERSGAMSNYPSHTMNDQSSSYQGTTTGPGPNDGYPATPRGSYETNYKPSGR